MLYEADANWKARANEFKRPEEELLGCHSIGVVARWQHEVTFSAASLGVLVNFVRVISISLVVLLLVLAYHDAEARVSFLIGAGFFGMLTYLSIRNAGDLDSPYVWWALAAVFFFYSLIGIIDGVYPWRQSTISLESDPMLFWTVFASAVAAGFVALSYGYSQKKHP